MSFEEIYNKYYRKLYAFAWQHTLSKPDSEDLVHESFLKLWNEIKRDTEIQYIQAWLYKVLINLIYTKKTRELRQTDKKMEIENCEAGLNDSNHPYYTIEKQNIINRELNLLPTEEKILLLLYFRGLKYSEIAEILNMNPNSVGTTLSRTITKFRNSLKRKHHELFE